MRILYYGLSAIVVGVLAHLLKQSILGDICGAMIGPFVVAIIDVFILVNSNFGLYVKGNTFYRNKLVRFSISYLFRIKVNGKYLLVRGHRIPDQFQPVGGVIKRFQGSNHIFSELKVLDDEHVPIDDISKDDLRVLVPGKNILTFMKWYESRKEREIVYDREFREELLQENVLPEHNFKSIQIELVSKHETKIHYSDHFQCPEILIAEIVELKPTQAQTDDLMRIINVRSENYIWADANAIRRKGYSKDGTNCRISDTALWTL